MVSPATTVCFAISAAGLGGGATVCDVPPGRASRWPGKIRLDQLSPLWASTSAVESPYRSAMELTVSPSATTTSAGTAAVVTLDARVEPPVCAFAFGWRLT